MPHVVTQSCCSDASCVYACPVNCIHPTPDEPDFLTAEMLHIDPVACVDCGACVSACPVDAIVPQKKLTEPQVQYLQINADYYKEPHEDRSRIGGSATRPALAKVTAAPRVDSKRGPLRVAIVGSGPAAMYAADELLTQPGVAVDVFDRLPVPHGLVRAGVAPDHQKTKQVARLYDTISEQAGFEYFLNVEVGRHITHDELLTHHHAVIYAVGASRDRTLGVPGEDLPGSTSATDFVAWYNGHPDHADDRYDLSHRRAVIVGNGNVALDVARILTADPDTLAGTDIAPYALEALRASRVEEVVIVARRGFAQSAFTVPEFAGLLDAPDVDVVVPADEAGLDPVSEGLAERGELDHAVTQKLRLLAKLTEPTEGRRRIVFRYLLSPTEIVGDDHATGITFARNEIVVGDDGAVRVKATADTETIDAGLVLTSIGYRGVPIDGVPFDDARGIIPNEDGRVLEAPGGAVAAGVYATGWIKRGPSGFIGTNKSCAQATVRHLVDDFNAGLLARPTADASALRNLVGQRQPAVIDRAGWQVIDAEERRRGAESGRVRVKITDEAELVAVARTAEPPVVAKRAVLRRRTGHLVSS
ncbi:FAD-dependent oxidoreductase [Rhodococcus sp. Q]|uniref:FAD-dependent oxidoreductase n=1 Tax=Rhodococcus sp. Q TaxID=2502252 RepID=UPI0010F8052D|nr:FAD-dependent oxidoreductase [Rhodococcus sp. Q]